MNLEHEAAGQTVSRYVIGRLLADDPPDRHPLMLTDEEQRAAQDGGLKLRAFVRTLRREPSGSELNLLSAIAVLAREQSPWDGRGGGARQSIK